MKRDLTKTFKMSKRGHFNINTINKVTPVCTDLWAEKEDNFRNK